MSEENRIDLVRHSLSHIMAEAVQQLFPGTKLAIGPAIDDGFYYDFDTTQAFTPDDLIKIEERMRRNLREKRPFIRQEIPLQEARQIFAQQGEVYKTELIDDLAAKGETVASLYHQGEWFDLCRGPHVSATDEIPLKGFKIDRMSGAYWRGDEHRPMLQRIYGLAYLTAEELQARIKQREEAAQRDHRHLGKVLDLFTFSDLVGKGLPLVTRKGATLWRILERFIVDEEIARGYEHVITPVLGKVDLYKVSGHWDHYRESMYRPIEIENEQYVLRPMTCPHHFMLYNAKLRSYRDLPVRLAEVSPMYRFEKSGELTGLIRIRGFHLADAHLMVTPDQAKDEFKGVLDLIIYVLETLGLREQCWFRASLRSEEKADKYIANEEMWTRAENDLISSLKELNYPFVEEPGHAAFYGPKLDVQIRNVQGKEDTLITNQIDFVSAERFDMHYIDKDGEKKRPVVLHRSSLGCVERTMAFLIEFYAGRFPIWLAPDQIKVLPVTVRQTEYCTQFTKELKKLGIRAELDARDETFNRRLREARLELVPYIFIAGDREMENQSFAVRNRDSGKQHEYPAAEIIASLLQEDRSRNLVLQLSRE